MNILEIKNMELHPWYFEQVLSPEDLKNYDFYFYSANVYDIIDVKNIVGTTHQSYYHKTWLEMLSHLKRHKDDINVEHITQIIQQEHDGKSVSEYSGKYYILEGNHRLCQAKFLEIGEVYCSITKYQFNHADFDLYQILINNGFTCSYKNGIFSNIQLYDLHIFIKSKELIKTLISEYKSINISRFKIIILLLMNTANKNEYQFLNFDGDEESCKLLKKALLHLELRKIALKK